MTKKTALNILILVIVAAIMVVVYFVFFQEDGDVNTNPNTNNNLPVASNFFPESENNSAQNQNNTNNTNGSVARIPKLRQISDKPTAGFALKDKTSTSTILVVVESTEDATSTEGVVEDLTKEEEVVEVETLYTYINRSNGNIYESTSKTLGNTRLTNTTIPKVYEAYFVDNRNLITQQLEDNLIKSTFISLSEYVPEETGVDATTTPETYQNQNNDFLVLEILDLPLNIKNILTSPNGLVFYTTPEAGGSLVGKLFDSKTPEIESVVFESEMNYLNFGWLSDNTLIFGTKPTTEGENFLFTHNIDSNQTHKEMDLGEVSLFNPNKTTGDVLLSEATATDIYSVIYNNASGEVYEIDANTFVDDKCVWSQKEVGVIYCAIPNSAVVSGSIINWYKGETSFTDSLYKIETVSGTKTKISGLDGEFDIIKPQLSENEDFFVFINKKDLTLWSLDLKN